MRKRARIWSITLIVALVSFGLNVGRMRRLPLSLASWTKVYALANTKPTLPLRSTRGPLQNTNPCLLLQFRNRQEMFRLTLHG